MINQDDVCCWISWNIFFKLTIFIILLGIPLGIYRSEQVTVIQLFTIIGAIVGGYFYYQRNKIFEKQLTQKDEQYIKDSQFKNFLEATKMLTNKDSTIEAKTSSLFLLYDVAKAHPQNIDRIIQVINKQLTPLLKCIEDNCETKVYTKKLVSSKKRNYPYNKKDIFEYTKNDIVNIKLNAPNSKRIIKEWQYKGNDSEKLISVSLYILKKIILNILIEEKEHIELSNTVIFDIDTDYDDNIKKFQKTSRPIENLIFLHCKLHKVDFKDIIYHQASFISCDLTDSDFTNANLWGSSFQDCNLKNVKFKDTECEATEFKKPINLKKEQVEEMKFQNKEDDKEYLIIVESTVDLGLRDNSYFTSLKDFSDWRYPSD